MGGSLGEGNTGPVQEFNIQLDPEAASVVLNSGADVTMVPLQVTHTVLVTPSILERVRGGTREEPATRFRAVIANLLVFFAETYSRVFGFTSGPPLHDPLAVAFVMAPQLFSTMEARVDVECVSPLTAGQTVLDKWRQ
jgi:inosine-uridine nucleoside N-ribohydrolase